MSIKRSGYLMLDAGSGAINRQGGGNIAPGSIGGSGTIFRPQREASIPLGGRDISVLTTRGGISKILSDVGRTSTARDIMSAPGEPGVPIGKVLQVPKVIDESWKNSIYWRPGITKAGVEYMERKEGGIESSLPGKSILTSTPSIPSDVTVRTSSPQILNGPLAPAPTASTTKNTGASSMDLGSLLGGIASDFITTKYGSPSYNPTPAYYGGSGYGTGGGITTTPALDIPFVDVVGEAPNAGMIYDPAGNCGNGKWRKKTRRRRKRLATASDIRDLAALKDTIGPSMTKTWIATHS